MIRKTAVLVGAVFLSALQPLQQRSPNMSFFITSVGGGDGGNLGGLAGADRHCLTLATAAGITGKTWRAYLSATAAGGQPAVNARDRIGAGPWFNFKGVQIAKNAADLHSDSAKISKATVLSEKGDTVNGRGDTPNRHDLITGSTAQGTLQTSAEDVTCNNWTSNSTGGVQVGHFDRQGGGAKPHVMEFRSQNERLCPDEPAHDRWGRFVLLFCH